MATLTVTLPAVVKLSNAGTTKVPFQPYHENFVAFVPAEGAVEFEVETAGQFFYYQEQAKNSKLVFKQLDAIEKEPAEGTIIIDLPALVTLTNVADHAVEFVPYRENFVVSIAEGDAVVIEAKTAGQVLYYVATEQVNKGIAVTFAAKE